MKLTKNRLAINQARQKENILNDIAFKKFSEGVIAGIITINECSTLFFYIGKKTDLYLFEVMILTDFAKNEYSKIVLESKTFKTIDSVLEYAFNYVENIQLSK